MKSLGDILISKSNGSEILTGNSVLVRAMIESGVKVVTSYPGSPTPEIADAIASIPREKNPMYFEFSVNEKVATEVAFGASVNGHLSCTFFKSVGLNVAADSFVQLGLMELIGGMVIVLGDDPGANSSQNEQDNRHYSKLSYIPMLEPSTPSEVYSMFKEAAKLSVEKRMPIIVRLTTHVCHAKEKIDMEPWEEKSFDKTPRFDPKNGPYIPLGVTVAELKRRALEKFAYFSKYVEKFPFNKFIDNGNSKRGIISWGVPYLSLLDVLEDVDEKPDILKLGTVNPIPEHMILEFLRNHEEVKILEELDDIMEKDVKALAYDSDIRTKIIGKIDFEDWIGEYTPDKVEEVLRKTWPDLLPESVPDMKKPAISVRPPQLCPGCGHRSAFYAIKKALKKTDITVADIGCHTLGYLEPYEMGQLLLCMGHSNGTAEGLSLFNESRKVVSFLGDSTFFHAGLPGIVNAIFNNHNHTLIIMDNGTTAMTGHQDHPGVGKNFNGEAPKIPIRQVLEGLGVKNIREVDTYQQEKLRKAVEEAVSEDGFNVVIAKHPCMLKFTNELRHSGKSIPKPVKITEDCDQRHVCVSEFGCPTFQIDEDGRVTVQDELCIGDGSCKQTCPVSAIVPSTFNVNGGDEG